MSSNPSIVRSAVSCVIFNQSPKHAIHPLKVYLIRRENEPWKGLWTFPGGKHENFENYEDATVREVKEETGFQVEVIKKGRPDFVTNAFKKD